MLSFVSHPLPKRACPNAAGPSHWRTFAVLIFLSQLASTALAQAAATIVPWPKNRATPALELIDTTGQAHSLSDQRGKVMLLNFWATWCEPCRAEMPALQQLTKRYVADRLLVWAINYKEPAGKVLQFQQQLQWDLPVLLDTDGQAAGQWTRRIFPTTVVIDTRGRARWIVTGEFDWTSDQAQQLLSPLLAKLPSPRL